METLHIDIGSYYSYIPHLCHSNCLRHNYSNSDQIMSLTQQDPRYGCMYSINFLNFLMGVIISHHHWSSSQEMEFVVQFDKFVSTSAAILFQGSLLHQWILHACAVKRPPLILTTLFLSKKFLTQHTRPSRDSRYPQTKCYTQVGKHSPCFAS